MAHVRGAIDALSCGLDGSLRTVSSLPNLVLNFSMRPLLCLEYFLIDCPWSCSVRPFDMRALGWVVDMLGISSMKSILHFTEARDTLLLILPIYFSIKGVPGVLKNSRVQTSTRSC